jgi:hypothetical protein
MTKFPRVITAVLAGAFLVGAASLATAGNHLKCYKGKDALGVKHKYSNGVLVSNTGLNPESGCIISTPPKICCDSVDKIGVPPQPGGGGPLAIASKFCCYKVKCPKGVTGNLPVQDQFGNRTLAVLKPPSLLCAPASPSGAFIDDAGF